MSTLTSIPVSDPKRFLTLQDSYKQELMGDTRLEEASAVAARRQMLMENPRVDPDWALPQVKAMSRKLNRLTKRIRQPFGNAPPTGEMFPGDADDAADDFAAGPVQALVKRLIPPLPRPDQNSYKNTPQPTTRQTQSRRALAQGDPLHAKSQEKGQADVQRTPVQRSSPPENTATVSPGLGNTHSL